MQVEVKYTNGEQETFDSVSSYSTQENGDLDIFSAELDSNAPCVATIARGMWIRIKKVYGADEKPEPVGEDDKDEDKGEDLEFNPLDAVGKRKTATHEDDGLTTNVN